jgi:hypothetical protein
VNAELFPAIGADNRVLELFGRIGAVLGLFGAIAADDLVQVGFGLGAKAAREISNPRDTAKRLECSRIVEAETASGCFDVAEAVALGRDARESVPPCGTLAANLAVGPIGSDCFGVRDETNEAETRKTQEAVAPGFVGEATGSLGVGSGAVGDPDGETELIGVPSGGFKDSDGETGSIEVAFGGTDDSGGEAVPIWVASGGILDSDGAVGSIVVGSGRSGDFDGETGSIEVGSGGSGTFSD